MTTPWLDDGDVQLYHGSAIDVLRSLPAGSVQTCVTSPPYWGLRDYGTGSWTGGDADCDHRRGGVPTWGPESTGSSTLQSRPNNDSHDREGWVGGVCGRCGAQRVDAQLGLEPTPSEYVAALVAVFAEVWRVLRADGTLWLNLGDSYAGGGGFSPDAPSNQNSKQATSLGSKPGGVPVIAGLKAKDLVGIPWKVAFALQEAGWYLRSDIIWAKPAPMPESVTDRPTKSHEYLFLLSKQPRYYWDASAISEPSGSPGTANGAAPSRPTLRPKMRATVRTHDGSTDAWGWHDFGQSEVSVDLAVTTDTGRFQVLYPIGFEVGVETPERDLVMHLERPIDGTVDTSTAVALQGSLSLLPPVWAAVTDAATSPCGALLASESADFPSAAALARAECVRLELAHIAEDLAAATLTFESQELRATLLVWGSLRPAHIRNIQPARNARSVWTINTQPTPDAHFATFPEALVRRCIQAGTSEAGGCVVCGAPWRRQVEVERTPTRPGLSSKYGSPEDDIRNTSASEKTGFTQRVIPSYQTTGWAPSCDCDVRLSGTEAGTALGGADSEPSTPRRGPGSFPYPTRPQVVLDPFMGSGTTALVARKLGRHATGIDLSADYLAIAARRLGQQSLFA